MIENYYNQNQPYQILQSSLNQPHKKTKGTSPKLQISRSSQYYLRNTGAENTQNSHTLKINQSNNNQHPSQNYDSYYAIKNNYIHSESLPLSNRSKHSRTERSKQKLKLLANLKQQNKKMLENQQLNYGAKLSNNHAEFMQQKNNLNFNQRQNSQQQTYSRPNRHMKTQKSRNRIEQHSNSQNKIHQNLKTSNHSNYSNKKSSKNYLTLQNLQNIPPYYQNQNSSTSPFHQYYANKQSHFHSQNNLHHNHHTHHLFHTPSHNNLVSLIPSSQRLGNSQSQKSSTVNTKNRPSSLSLNKFHNKPMLTFYHCQLKKHYTYNDQGYLTNKEYRLKQLIEKRAIENFDRVLESQATLSKTRKSHSVSDFPRMNTLKEKTERQKKNNLKKQNEEKIKGQKINNPSQLPPSSTLSKRKFNVIYKEQQNDNLLQKLSINDDSYHEREERRFQSQFIESKDKLMNRRKNKLKIDQDSEISSNENINRPNEKVQAYKFVSGAQCENTRQVTNLQNSNIGGVQKSRQSFTQEISEKSNSSFISNRQEKNSPSQLSQNSKYSQNKSKRPAQLSKIQSIQKSKQNNQDKESLKNSQKQSQLGLRSKESIKNSGQSIQKSNLERSAKSLKLISSKNINSKIQKINPSKMVFTQYQNDQKEDQEHLPSSLLGFQSKISSKKLSNSINPLVKIKSNQQKRNEYQLNEGMKAPDFKKKTTLNQLKLSSNTEMPHQKAQKTVSIHSNKKSSLLRAQKATKLQNPQIKKQNQSNLQLSSKNSQKSSVKSEYLELDSANHLPKSQYQNLPKVSSSKNLYHTTIVRVNETQKELPINSQTSITSSKKPIHSESQLLKQSCNDLKMDSKISNNLKNSNYTCQLQVQNSQRLSQKSQRSSKSHRNAKGIKINLEIDEQNQNKIKYGNLLTVKAPQSKQKQNNLSIKKDTSQIKISQNNKQSSLTNKKIQSIKNNQSSHRSSYNEQSIQQFNLIEKIDDFLDVQEELNQKRRNLQEQQQVSQQMQEVMAKIQGHFYLIREILQVAVFAMEMYSEDSTWVFKSCIFSLKKYLLERNKMIDSLSGKKSCFKIAQYQVVEQDLKQFLKHPTIQQLKKDIQQCNSILESVICEFIQHLNKYSEQGMKEISSKAFDDRFDLGILLQQFRTQILGLKDKKIEITEGEQQIEEEAIEIINKRIFKLMQATFLLSELAGKRIKQFTEQIDYIEDFQEYIDQYWPYFERIVKTFA